MKKILLLFVIGGGAYYSIELTFRGHSHWSMFVVGGICFLLIGAINEFPGTQNMGLLKQMFFSMLIITGMEYISGWLLNIKLKLQVWDYSAQPFNYRGQICLLFMGIWFFLSLIGILLDDEIRFLFYGEPKPSYHLLKTKKENKQQNK